MFASGSRSEADGPMLTQWLRKVFGFCVTSSEQACSDVDTARCFNGRGTQLSVMLLAACWVSTSRAQFVIPSTKPQALRPGIDAVEPESLSLHGNTLHRWVDDEAQVSHLTGRCHIKHRDRLIETDEILVIADGPIGNVRNRVIYHTGDQGQPLAWFEIQTLNDPDVHADRFEARADDSSSTRLYKSLIRLTEGSSKNLASPFQNAAFAPPFSGHASQADQRDQAAFGAALISRVQFEETLPGEVTSQAPQNTFYVAGGSRSIEFRSRDAQTSATLDSEPLPGTLQTAYIARGGVTLVIRDVAAEINNGQLLELGNVTLSADQVVFWGPPLTTLFGGGAQDAASQGEVYLEGNIVFRQGDRFIYADRMYYNVATSQGVILDAEAITTIPEYQSYVRLKSKVLQQISQGNFVAFDAAVTTSRMGVPRYWLQSDRLTLQDRGRLEIDPATQTQTVRPDYYISSGGNFIYVGGFPVFYWPTLATRLEVPTLYVTDIDFSNDDIFGTRVEVAFDPFQVFGIENPPDGLESEISVGYLSERGFAVGTSSEYNFPSLFGIRGPVQGIYDSYLIDDDGLDTLGQDRTDVEPEEDLRGRSLLRHRHYLPNDFEFIAQIGVLSDRTFLEQYLENEWDQDVDHQTAIRLRKYLGSNLFDLHANVQVNDFFRETERLPQLDHYLLGGSLFGDRISYSARNSIGYSQLNAAEAPTSPQLVAETFPLDADIDRNGIIASSKHQFSLPAQFGALRVVPSVAGEVTHYGEAVDGDDLTRLTGEASIRATLPMWRVDPNIQSSLLNLRGLAHKLEWTAEYFYADSNTNLEEVPFYDPLDDTSQIEFRRRFIGDIFGGVLPPQYDPRIFAFRQGIQRGVASPSPSVVDDLQQIRLGLHQRFQTKRGLPGRERITDVFYLDTDLILFPEATRDNFGETLGPLTYDARWHLGDRVSLLSDGYFDFFDDGLRSVSAGVTTSRPGVGDVYVGLLSLEGPISSTVLRANLNYRLNEKWIGSASTTYDFSSVGNVGQAFGLTRIGESFLVQGLVNVDPGRDNVSFGFAIEPRFFPQPRLGRLGGTLIPPPGVEGLE
ncbi:MAG: organic solvent tolerance protein OstA [Planctomycetota bacterium]